MEGFEIEEMEAGDEFMAVKPWLGAMKPPTNFDKEFDRKALKKQKKPPQASLELEYVHGYRAKDTRNNLKYLESGKALYHAAALGIVLNIDGKREKNR